MTGKAGRCGMNGIGEHFVPVGEELLVEADEFQPERREGRRISVSGTPSRGFGSGMSSKAA